MLYLVALDRYWTRDNLSVDAKLYAVAPFQYPKRRLFVRSGEVSKPRDLYFKSSYRFEIWQAHRQQCCRSACRISERSDNSKYKSRSFETLRDLTERRLIRYWDGAQESVPTSYNITGKRVSWYSEYKHQWMNVKYHVSRRWKSKWSAIGGALQNKNNKQSFSYAAFESMRWPFCQSISVNISDYFVIT